MTRNTRNATTDRPTPQPEMYSRADAAIILGCSQRQLRRWISDGHINVWRISDQSEPFITREELDRVKKAYLRKGR